jgi:formylglycine-generating enzyme required for sulfatase activity
VRVQEGECQLGLSPADAAERDEEKLLGASLPRLAIGEFLLAGLIVLAAALALAWSFLRRKGFQFSLARLLLVAVFVSVGAAGLSLCRASMESDFSRREFLFLRRMSVECETSAPHYAAFRVPFYMSDSEVTWDQYVALMGKEAFALQRSLGDKGNMPVRLISLADAREYCITLSARIQRSVRLPTEDEWEYACRAGSNGFFSSGNNIARAEDECVFASGTQLNPAVVRSKVPNRFGLYDMHGNVWEWCNAITTQANEFGKVREVIVIRGGGYTDPLLHCHASVREIIPTGERRADVGFRCVVSEGAPSSPRPDP